MDLPRATSLLSPKQIRSIAHANARTNLWTGAIRSGKTVASLLRWLMYVAEAPDGELVMVGRTTHTIGRNVFLPLQDERLFGPLADQTHYTLGAPTGTILGRRVHVIGANDVRAETKLRGLTCAGAYADEVSLLPEAFFTQLLGRMSVDGSKLFGTSNPDSPAHWLRSKYILRADDPAMRLRHWHFTLDDNPNLSDEIKASYKAEFTGLFYKRMVEGLWVAAEGAVFDMFDESRHVVDIIPPIERWLCLTIDYGTTNPLHALVIGLGVDGRLYVVAEWRYDSKLAHRQLTDAEYSQRLRQWLTTVPIPGAARRVDGTRLAGVQPEYVVVDPSAASFRVQLHNDGLTNVAANNDVLDGIRLLSSLFAMDLLKVSRNCPELIAELPGYSWDDKASLAGEDKPIKVADHGVDALRYGAKTTRSLWQGSVQLLAA